MPQMSPMLWSLLFIYFLILFILFNILNYFNFSISAFNTNKNNMENDPLTANKTSLNWKW